MNIYLTSNLFNKYGTHYDAAMNNPARSTTPRIQAPTNVGYRICNIQLIGLPSSIFGETCDTKGYLCSIDSFLLYIKIVFWFFKIWVFSKILCNSKLKWHERNMMYMSVDIHFSLWKRQMTLWIWSWISNEICQTYTLLSMMMELELTDFTTSKF